MLLILFVTVVVSLGVFSFDRLYATDPYIQDVLALQGDAVRGHAIFQINCAGCHGLEAGGQVGPSLQQISAHRSPTRIVKQVISGKTPPMPKFQPAPQDMADLLSYLETL